MANLTGRVLKKRYRIDALLGEGGMAEVYQAYDTRRLHSVAIKVMRPDLAEDREFIRRFQQEAESLAALAHSNIVRFYSLEKDGRLIFLVMDYVRGITLRTLIFEADGPLPPGQVAHIFPQMCQALHYAHEEGFIHRDIKPGNIMLQPDGRVFVTDFGIAKATDAATITTFMPGTPAYMSPEQCRSEPLDRRSDIYALGIVLFEMVTGDKPFLGKTESITGSSREKVRWEHMHTPPPSPRQFNPDLPEALESVILKAMAKDPNERFATALELMDAFDKGMGHAGKQVPPVTVESLPPRVEELSSADGRIISDVSISTTFQHWLAAAQRKPQLTALTVVIGLALMGGLFWSIFGFEPPSNPTITATVVADHPGTETVGATRQISAPTNTPTPGNAKSPTIVIPGQTTRPRPTQTPTPTRTPKRSPTPTPIPRLSVTINGRTRGSFNVGSEVEFCFSSTRPTRAEAKLYYGGQSFDLDEFDRLSSREACLSKTADRPGEYSVEIIALDRSDKEVASKSIDFEAINPLPNVSVNIYRGQICPGSCYDYGSQADFCVSSNFTTRVSVNVYGPNNSSLFASLGDWNLNGTEQCVSGPMPVPQGRYNFEVRSLDNPAVSRSHQFDVCDCPGQ